MHLSSNELYTLCLLHNFVDKDNNLTLKKAVYLLTLAMQGKKEYQEKLFAHFQLSDRIPTNNFYRRLKQVLRIES